MVHREANSSGLRARSEAIDPGRGGGDSAPGRDLIGSVLGDFEVEGLLGRGGMGEVYRARQLSLGRTVALKVLKPEMVRDPTSRARLEAEASAAARLSHPNIVHVYAFGEADGHAFLAMEFVPGSNLRAALERHGPPELSRAFSIMRQATSAVAEAGEAGLVHRDLKPENLLLTAKGQVKVADFGLCRLPDSEHLNLTAPEMALGTPLYMSPEQIQGRAIDHRSDLYALGATFHHLLTGRPPFEADTPLALALKHVREAPTPPSELRQGIPSDLSDLVLRLLSKDPADRFQTARALLRELAAIRERYLAGATTRTLPATTTATEVLPITDASAEPKPPRLGGPSGWRIGVPLTLAGLLSGLLVGRFTRPSPPTPSLMTTMPALWIADWRAAPERPSAISQYRLAQTGTTRASRLAAWLAVPGRFPDEADVAYRAYVQLARDLLRDGDAERLSALADDLETWSADRPDRPLWTALAAVAEAGADALSDRAMAARARFQDLNLGGLDPAVAELALETVGVARRSASGAGPDAPALARLADELRAPLGLDGLPGRFPAAFGLD